MKENGFNQPKNQFSLSKIQSFFKNWPTLISVTVSTQTKNSEQKKTFPLARKTFSLVGMKDFLEIQYLVLWKLCFHQSYFWLGEIIIGSRGKLFSKKDLIICLVETGYFCQCYFAASCQKPLLESGENSFERKRSFLLVDN